MSNTPDQFDFERFAQTLAASESRIVAVGIVDGSNELVYSNFRENTTFYASFETIRHLMTATARFTMSEVAKLEPPLGKVEYVVIRFDKRVIVCSRLNNYVIVLGLDTEVPTPFPDYITTLIMNAAARTRTGN